MCPSASDLYPASGPLARFESLIADPSTPNAIFQRLVQGQNLRDVARDWMIPRKWLMQWFLTRHADLYDAGLKARAGEILLSALRNFSPPSGTTAFTFEIHYTTHRVSIVCSVREEQPQYCDKESMPSAELT